MTTTTTRRQAGGGFAPTPIPALAAQGYPWGEGNPRIVQTFTPGIGWIDTQGWEKATITTIRGLRQVGVTRVGLAVGLNRVADWGTDELLKTAAPTAPTTTRDEGE